MKGSASSALSAEICASCTNTGKLGVDLWVPGNQRGWHKGALIVVLMGLMEDRFGKKAFSHCEFFGLLSLKGAAAAIGNQCYVAAAIPQWPLAASRCRSRSRQPGVKILEVVPGSALQKPPTKSRFPSPLPRSVPKPSTMPLTFWIFMPRWWGLHIQQGGHWSCVASYSHEEWAKAGLLIGGKTHRCFLEVWCAALRNYVKWPAGMMIQHCNLTSCCIVGTKGQPHQVILKRE